MKIGLQIPNFTWPGGPAAMGSTLERIARVADEVGFYSLWVMDHFFQIRSIGPHDHDMLKGYTTLGYLAALTHRVKLGTMATGVIYRYPGVLIKTVTTLDVLSAGRAYFGIGAGWNEQESRGLGVPFPSLRERFELLEEALQIAKQMWSANDGPYQGRHNQLAETLCVPQPLSRPHPPVLVAGGGEKKTLRLVARYGDACNLYGNPEAIGAKLAILKQHCLDLGRDYESIERTSLSTVEPGPGKMSVSEVLKLCRALAAVGVQHAIFNMPNVQAISPLELFGREVIPAAAAL